MNKSSVIKLVIKVVSAIIFAIVSAVGYSLDIAQITDLDFRWWPLIGFVIFFGLVTWIFLDLYGQNSKLLNTKPKIKVEPLKENNILYLKVHNDGAEGIFKAQIDLSSDDPGVLCLPHYNGYWKYGNKAETKILKGHDDLLKIAELFSSQPPGSISQYLKFYFFDSSTICVNYLSSSSHWLGATITSKDGTTRPLTKHKYELNVTISSSPELMNGYFREKYFVDINGWK